jgi:HD-GYP domain-containing protein (c-di-GMP phosphodiesterase class II)
LQISIPASRLEVGMYVVLPSSWLNHPFWRSHFLIREQEQVETIRQHFPDTVVIDPERSDPAVLARLEGEPQRLVPQQAPPPSAVMSAGTRLAEVLRSDEPVSAEQAEAVYGRATRVVHAVLSTPSSEAVDTARRTIDEMVDRVAEDPDIRAFLVSVAQRDYYAYTHSVNVGVLGVALAIRLYGRMPAEELRELGAGLFFHDIGKAILDPSTVNRMGSQSQTEISRLRRHPVEGHQLILRSLEFGEASRLVILQHHERDDGKGYPEGLTRSDIHEFARLCAVVDRFDGLCSNRADQRARSPYQALRLMAEETTGRETRLLVRELVLLLAEQSGTPAAA